LGIEELGPQLWNTDVCPFRGYPDVFLHLCFCLAVTYHSEGHL